MPPSTEPIHNDLPTLGDKLNWKHEIERMAGRVQHCPTPHVLGVHGDWGSGKTSFMRQMQYRLGGEMPADGAVAPERPGGDPARAAAKKQVATVWFDAWRYQHEAVPVVALLQEMRRQLSTLPAVMEKFKAFGAIALRSMLDSLPELGKLIGAEGIPSAEKMAEHRERWQQARHAGQFATDSIREHLQQTIACLLPKDRGTGEARLVVFIDDLDRCNPKAAVRLLEGLKIYLSIPRCVFVLGMNERVLTEAIRDEISAPGDSSKEALQLHASHYLEKICTDLYRLPLPTKATELFLGWLGNEDHRQALQLAIGATTCLPPNPRRLKALANQWPRFAACVPFPTGPSTLTAQDTHARQKRWAVRVLVAAYIHQFHRDLWERWHFSSDFWNSILTWCVSDAASASQPPDWAKGLKLTERVTGYDANSQATLEKNHHNPGDLENFWIGGLVIAHKDDLSPGDFQPLLRTPEVQP